MVSASGSIQYHCNAVRLLIFHFNFISAELYDGALLPHLSELIDNLRAKDVTGTLRTQVAAVLISDDVCRTGPCILRRLWRAICPH